MAELVRVDDGVDRLDDAASGVELDHAEHEPVGVVQHRPRMAVDPGQPKGDTERPAAAEQARQQVARRNVTPGLTWLSEHGYIKQTGSSKTRGRHYEYKLLRPLSVHQTLTKVSDGHRG